MVISLPGNPFKPLLPVFDILIAVPAYALILGVLMTLYGISRLKRFGSAFRKSSIAYILVGGCWVVYALYRLLIAHPMYAMADKSVILPMLFSFSFCVVIWQLMDARR